MRAAVSSITVLALIATTGRWGHPDTIVGATREIPDGAFDYTPSVPDLALESGQYAPRVALEVLPGPNGLAPDVAITYSAKRANGVLGAGWGLSLESMIERKSKHGGMPEMTGDDTYWVDGQKLIVTSDGTYRTEHNDFTVYTRVLDLFGMNVVGWTAMKDGIKRTFGMGSFLDTNAANAVEYRDEDASSGTATGSDAVGWRLSYTSDPFGGVISYAYVILGTRQHYLDKITYASTAAGRTEINLGYELRDDVRASYANGPKRTESRRLRRIVVKRFGTATATSHYYLFLYEDAVHSPQSMLSEVKRVSVANPLSPPTSTNEASVASESLARFGYNDSTTAWGERQALTLVGDPPTDVSDPGNQYFSMSQFADVNADALVDLIVFNDSCEIPTPNPENFVSYICTPDHRVYLNTISENRFPNEVPLVAGRAVEAVVIASHVFVYDADLSADVTAFFSLWHDSTLTPSPIQVVDLGRDGYADLIKPQRLSVGSRDGWNHSGVVANWNVSTLEDHQFADLNGDGFPDLVGQTSYLANTGVTPFIPSVLQDLDLVDPVVEDHASADYDTVSTSCLDASDLNVHPRFDLGIKEGLNDPPSAGEAITAAEWVWRNTINADFNGDGLMDRAISVPFLHLETTLESPGAMNLWVRDDDDCGVFDQIFFGDGRGSFTAAGYGIGGPMQRSDDMVVQVRSLADSMNLSNFVFTYPVNHFAMGDFDADGRYEITQFCSGDSFVALWDQGVNGPGYGLVDNGACPTQAATVAVPEEFFGLSMLDYHHSTIADIDGDGMPDLVQYSHPFGHPDVIIDNADTPWAEWEDGPHWRRNQRTTAQNRLTSITWPHGGRTQVTWAWSAEDPGNEIPINVEHVATITNANGRSVYSFENGAFDDGEFMGFGRVETFQPRGSTLVETFLTLRAVRNKRSTEELYDEGGRLKNLRVHIHGSDAPNWWPLGSAFGWDGIAPYYNPELRRCEFELGAFNAIVPLGTDIDGYIARCEAFDDEPGLFVTGVLTQRTISAVLRGGDPVKLAPSAPERRELIALRDLLNGRDPRPICTRGPDDPDNLPPPPQMCRRFTVTPGDVATDAVFGPDNAGVAVTFSPAPNPTRWDTAFEASDLPPWGAGELVVQQDRMYVNEYTYEVADGHVLEHRELRDASTGADSLIHTFTYSTWDAALAGVHLVNETTTNRYGHTFENIDYENFQHGLWRRRVAHESGGASTQTEKRTFTARGDIATSTNPLDQTTEYLYSDCGVQTSKIDPLGYADESVLDAACRPTTQRRKLGSTTIARTTFLRDGHGRVTSQTVNPSFGSGAMPLIRTELAYDSSSSVTEPARVEIAPEPDGTSTLIKTYVDGHGRPIKTVRCNSSGMAGGGANLDATYPCIADTVVATETHYAADTGDPVETVGPYLDADLLRPSTSTTFDEFGRKVVVVDPLGRTTSYDYGLGKRAVIDPIGRRTQVTFTTLAEDITIAGIYQGGTRRDPFGRITATIDAASNQADLLYDGYNRKRQQLSPSVNVLASGATTETARRLTASFTYDAADRVLTETDANDRVTIYSYDDGGRLVSTWGPDRDGDGAADELERRTYVDGGYGVGKIVILDPQLGVDREDHLDGLGRVWKQVNFDDTVVLTDYDIRGRAFRVTSPWGEIQTTRIHDGGLTVDEITAQGALVATTTTTLDAGGRPLTITDADGAVVTHEYDLAGRLVTTWEGSREVEHKVYDYAGRPTQIRTSGALTCLTYDSLDHVTLEERGCLFDGLRTGPSAGRGLVNIERSYTASGQLDTEIDATGAMVDHDYDAVGRLTATTVFDSDDVSQGTRTFAYDGVGNLTKEVDELGLVTRTEYDVRDQVVAIDPPDADETAVTYTTDGGSWVAITTAPTGESSEQRTDAMGRTWRTCSTSGTCVENHYADGRLVSRGRKIAAIGAEVASQFVQYHAASTRVRSETDWLSLGEVLACGAAVPDGCTVPRVERTWTTAGRPETVTDPQGNTTHYEYATDDHSMVLTRVRQPGMPDQDLTYATAYPIVVERRFSDPDGPAEIVETTQWERDFRVESVARTSGWLLDRVTFEYDDAGRRSRSVATRGTESVDITDTYDARGNPLTRNYVINGFDPGTLSYTWRNNGQLATATLPSTRQVVYNYDATGRLLRAKLGAAPVFEALDPDASGRARTLKFDSNAIRVERTFDTAGREATREIFGTTATKRTETYSYDNFGRLAYVGVSYGTNTGSSAFLYNYRDRLTSEAHTLNAVTRTIAYDHDPVTGLRMTKTDTMGASADVTAYDYDDGNRLAMVDAVAIDWDAYGRQTSDAAGRTFQWGLANQLVGIEEASVLIESNLFDADRLRVARTTPSGGTEYFLPGPDGTIVEHIAGETRTDYVRLPDGATVATIDHQTGNVTGVVESITGSPYRIGERGAAHLYVDATAFGEPITTDGTLDEDLGFHGMFATEASEISIAGVRAYDSTTGRFLTADPLGYGSAAEAVDAADFFAYAQNNPVGMSDPTGFAPLPTRRSNGSHPRAPADLDGLCLMTASGGCVSRDQTYEQQQAANRANFAAEEADKERVQHDRDVLVVKDVIARLFDGAEAESGESTDSRAPADTEQTSEPVDSGSSGNGGGRVRNARPRSEHRQGRSRETGGGGGGGRRGGGGGGDDDVVKADDESAWKLSDAYEPRSAGIGLALMQPIYDRVTASDSDRVTASAYESDAYDGAWDDNGTVPVPVDGITGMILALDSLGVDEAISSISSVVGAVFEAGTATPGLPFVINLLTTAAEGAGGGGARPPMIRAPVRAPLASDVARTGERVWTLDGISNSNRTRVPPRIRDALVSREFEIYNRNAPSMRSGCAVCRYHGETGGISWATALRRGMGGGQIAGVAASRPFCPACAAAVEGQGLVIITAGLAVRPGSMSIQDGFRMQNRTAFLHGQLSWFPRNRTTTAMTRFEWSEP